MMKIIADNGDEIEITKDLREKFLEFIAQGTEQKGHWIPKPGNKYFYICSGGWTGGAAHTNSDMDNYRIQRGNCFQTEAGARRYRDIDVIIYWIVFEKNQEKPLDWKTGDQKKWRLYYDCAANNTKEEYTHHYKYHKTPHCSQPFLDDVLKEISQADLDWYMVRG